MTRIAIMQPYFVPYPGYFRLFLEADLFVIYDCVQFPRRGYVHRNQLPDAQGHAQWLTLPLKGTAQETPIHGLEFADDSVERLAGLFRKFPCLDTMPPAWEQLFAKAQGPLVPWLSSSLELSCRTLGLECPTLRSSDLQIPSHHRGQDRIIEICKALGATSYVNAPGGRDLYSEQDFQQEGIELMFLSPYTGSPWSILFDLCTDRGPQVATELSQSTMTPYKGST